MKHKGKYFKKDGVQLCVYPMAVMGISQGMFEGFSHKGRATIDDAGADFGIDNVFAPFDAVVSWRQATGDMTGILISSKKPVWVPKNGGMLTKVNVILWHDNHTKDLYKGKSISQGEIFYQEGTAGFATGNHVHMGVSFGNYDGLYPLVKNAYGNYEIKNEELVYDAFWVNDTVIKNGKDYPWKTYVEPVITTTPPVPPVTFAVNDNVFWSGHLHRDSYGGSPTRIIYPRTPGVLDVINLRGTHPYHIKGRGWVAKSQLSK